MTSDEHLRPDAAEALGIALAGRPAALADLDGPGLLGQRIKPRSAGDALACSSVSLWAVLDLNQ